MEHNKRYFLVTAKVGYDGGFADVHSTYMTHGTFLGNKITCDAIETAYFKANPQNKPTSVVITFILEVNESDFNDYCDN